MPTPEKKTYTLALDEQRFNALFRLVAAADETVHEHLGLTRAESDDVLDLYQLMDAARRLQFAGASIRVDQH
jgi:hypothetical protein